MIKKIIFIISLVIMPTALQAKITAEELSEVLYAHPEIVANAMQKYQEKEKSREEAEAVKRYKKNYNSWITGPDIIFEGKENSKVVLVEFFDFSCGYCKRLAPEIVEIAKSNPDIKIVFKPLAFVSQTSPYAQKASIAAYNQGKFLKFYEAIFASDNLTEEKINRIAEKIGLDMNQYYRDISSEHTKNIADNLMSTAQDSGVNGVPSLFSNGEHINERTKGEIMDIIRKKNIHSEAGREHNESDILNMLYDK